MTTRKEWVARVASAAAANLGASMPHEAVGLSEAEVEDMSETEYGRLASAIEDVQQRLYRMGAQL
jgi:hypothetical protein